LIDLSVINQSINLYSPMQLQANNKKVWQAVGQLAISGQKDRQITVHITTQKKCTL